MNNAVNRLWGEVAGVGQNMLGVMLMELRSELGGEAVKTNARLSERTGPSRMSTP